ncbi:MAG: potassium channel family protein [Candidatus Thorarchaeota archaeon]
MQEDLQEVEYQPIPVRTLLVEMKNLSELMIDLAYSAVMFNDKDLAEEVMDMEKRVDYLSYLLLMNASLAVRDKNDAEQIVSIMKSASAANKISDAAADIAGLVLHDIGIPGILWLAVSQADEIVGRATILGKSILIGKTLADVNLEEEIGSDIIAIQRKRNWTINPPETFKFQKSDRVIARGSQEGIKKLQRLAAGELEEIA